MAGRHHYSVTGDSMTPIHLFITATRQVCEENGTPLPSDAEYEFNDPDVTRVADVFAEMVLTERASELEQENRLLRNRVETLDRALTAWIDKTDWVQKSATVHEMGHHRADIIRARMARLQAERDGIALAIVERLERACGANGMPPTLVRREFLPERPCVAHLPPDDTEGGSHD